MLAQEKTQLSDFRIPYLPMVIEEAFSVLCYQSGQLAQQVEHWTIAELAQKAHMSIDGVQKRLETIELMSEQIEISPQQLKSRLDRQEKNLFLLDVREPWEFALASLNGSHLMAKLDLARIFEGLKETTVITICHQGVRSLSAALYLKEAGLPKVFSLQGGVDAWARDIDPTMEIYS